MKKILFLALLLIVACETTNDSDTVKIFKCLLIDSDVTYNYINNLVDAVDKNDPVKLASVFSTIYPAIAAEYVRCKTATNGKVFAKTEEIQDAPFQNIPKIILKIVIKYVLPVLKKLGINLAEICKKVFPDLPWCELFA